MRGVERGINRGFFITPEYLEQRRPSYITQMLENYPSIRVSGRRLEFAQILGTGDCRMTEYLDGTRVIGKFDQRSEDPINTIDATFTHLFDPDLVPLLDESDILSVRTRLAHQFPKKINTTVNGLIQTQQLRDDPNTDPRFRTAPFNRIDATVSRQSA